MTMEKVLNNLLGTYLRHYDHGKYYVPLFTNVCSFIYNLVLLKISLKC